MPEVTILLPVYNGANYLNESIESVLSQEYSDFELHILDDGSEDHSASIAQNTGDVRVRYSRNPERYGLFKTLNRGFSEASSPLIRIWAQDDRMLPGSLQHFVDFAHMHPTAGMIYCDFSSIDADGNRTGGEALYSAQRARTPAIASTRLSAFLFWCYGCLPGNISTVMLRRSAWEKVGGFLTGFQQAPDYDMWVRISALYDVGFIREPCIELRDHPLQLSKQGQKQMTTIEEELPVIRQLEERLEGLLTKNEMRAGWRTERGCQHIHWIMRAILRADINSAARGWRAVRAYGQPWRQTLFWLLSANGRLFKPDRHLFFDEKAMLFSNLHNG